MLQSLRYEDMNFRSNAIVESYPDTFDWIFKALEISVWDRFDTWLRSGSGIYWIHGKPGSGKSTLMKFIATHSRTEEELSLWSKDQDCLKLSFYFWLAGTNPMQRNIKGLLCSLLSRLPCLLYCVREKCLQERKSVS